MSFRNLTPEEIAFRVLLRREEGRSRLTFGPLEGALPKQIRQSIEPDWRSYIRDEGLEFDSAHQKAVHKHLPGVYYEVMATEFLGKLPFHIALRCFLQPVSFDWKRHGLSEEEVFELAEYLVAELRKRRPAGIRDAAAPHGTAVPKPKSVGPTRRWGSCKQQIRLRELANHIDREHRNPPRLGSSPVVVPVARVTPPTPVARANPRVLHENTTAILARAAQADQMRRTARKTRKATPEKFDRFRQHRCIGCRKIPIPGDFYCYSCALD